jgi:hypothetical protein
MLVPAKHVPAKAGSRDTIFTGVRMTENTSTINYPQSSIEFLKAQHNAMLRALRHNNKANSNTSDQTFMAKHATFRPKRLSFVPEGTKTNPILTIKKEA